MLAVVAAAWRGLASAQTPIATGRQKIQFSEPSSPVVASNLNELSRVKLDPLQPMESSAVKDIMEVSSAAPQFQAPRPAPAVTGGRTRGSDERLKNWAMDDLNGDFLKPGRGESTGIPGFGFDSTETNAPSKDEKLKKDAGAKQLFTLTTDQLLSGVAALEGRNDRGADTNTFSLLNQAIPESDRFLKTLYLGVPNQPGGNEAAAGDSPSLIRSPEDRAQQTRLEEFRKSLPGFATMSPGSLIDASGLLNDLTHQIQQPAQSGNPLNTGEADRNFLNPQMGLADHTGDFFHPHVLDDPTARALGLPNPVPPPPVERVKPPPAYDPYANLPKRKF
jgi:hypothetical protein